MNFSSENLRHRRLVHAANALVTARYPSKLALQRLSELWLNAALALPESRP